MELALTVNGFDLIARYPDETVENVLLPLLRELTVRQRALGRRLILLLAAPPGVGKSTLAAALEEISCRDETLTRVQALGMDGFHHHQDYLLSHTARLNGQSVSMAKIKGMPETFDVKKLQRALLTAKDGPTRWPVYDRRIHDVTEDALEVAQPILIVEGNWLLLNRPIWRDLFRDETVFIGASEEQLRERLIARKMRGGLPRSEAEAFYERTDGPNIRLCMTESLPADLTLTLGEDGRLIPNGFQ